ncbi:hypothetical protein, partial [Velocimicrobium porci]|uniref:hypothetical protein n=1 Tax=Velocimicrobium porci TaxID=2606634 RepID=UPI00197B7E8C
MVRNKIGIFETLRFFESLFFYFIGNFVSYKAKTLREDVHRCERSIVAKSMQHASGTQSGA